MAYIPFLYLDSRLGLQAFSSERERLVFEQSDVVHSLLNMSKGEKRNVFYNDNSNLTFAVIYMEQTDEMLLLGGVFLKDRLRNAEGRHLFIDSEEKASDATEYFNGLPIIDKGEFVKYVNWMNYMFNRRNFFLDYIKYSITADTYDTSAIRINLEPVWERNFKHTAFQFEQKMISYIKSGNTVLMKKLFEQAKDLMVADLAVSRKKERNVKNQLICGCTIATRAAIEGGLDPETAYSISDYYINLFEEIGDISKLSEKGNEMFLHFTEKVSCLEKLKPQSQIVNHAIMYINENITEPLNLEKIALKIGINKDYLSEIFKKETNMSLVSYIQKMKVAEACLMLQYSNASIVEISEKLSFSSQSYFTSIFKKFTSVTPLAFRNQKRGN